MRFFLYHRRYGGQMFDVDNSLVDDLKTDLHGLGWRENQHLAREADQPASERNEGVPDLDATDAELSRWSKTALEAAARDQLGIDLDRRKTIPKLIADIRAAQEA